MRPLPLLWFTLLALSVLFHQYHVNVQSDTIGPLVWKLYQNFDIQASSRAFSQQQTNSLIYPFFTETKQSSNSTAAINASAFVFACFFQPSADTSSGPSLSSTIFALCMTGVAPYQDSSSNTLKGYPFIIWTANRLTPAHGETISLVLKEDGDLVLRGLSNGIELVAWRSNTSGMGVARMELSQQPPNLVLYDADNGTVWKSADYPADTLVYGQKLEEGKDLVSYASSDNISEHVGEYRLRINRTLHELTLLFKNNASSEAIPYWKQQFDGTTAASESPEGSCGPDSFSCNTPTSGPLSVFTAFINSQGLCLGDPSIGGNYTTIKGLTYPIPEQDLQTTILQLGANGSLRLISIKEPSVVLGDLFSADATCLLPQVCGTYGAPSTSPLDSTLHRSNARKVALGVGVSIVALFLASVFLFFLWRRKHRNKAGEFGAFVSVDDSVLGNAVMLKLPPRYSYKELQTATKGFSHRLGRGGFGSVYAGSLADGTTKVAVKKLEGMRQGEKEFITELAIMGGIHHYNLLQLMGYCAEGIDQRLLVYKYMENGSLDQWLFASSSAKVTTSLPKIAKGEQGEQAMARLKWGVRYKVAIGVAKGLAYLHEGCEKRIIHLDIKPQNILLDEEFVAKVADFGLSRGMDRKESHVVTTMRGTPGYLAPEWLKDGTIDVKCDVFSFGMLLMEIVSGRKNVDESRTEAPFYPGWAYSHLISDKLVQSNDSSNESKSLLGHTRDASKVVGKTYNCLLKACTVDDLTDAKLESELERAQVLRLITVAFLCVLEKPEWRPPMSKVVQMLEGHISLSHIDLSSLHQGLIFVLGLHNSSFNGSPGYDSRALAIRREFQEQLESILALSSSSFAATSSSGQCSQVSG